MTDSPRKPGSDELQPKGAAIRSVGRRRWLQAGISAAPVAMTVASRPVLAIDCRTPSGFVSGFASGAPAGVCGGGKPSYWAPAERTFPSPYDRASSKFNAYFTPNLSGNPTFVEVLGLSPGNPPLQSYVVAALLNSAGTLPLVPLLILPVATIQAMWTQCNAGGFSLGITGVWNAAEVIAYLQSTMTLS
jgi:hypothetical protein